MGKVFETILDFVLLIICTISLICIIGANNNAIAANDYLMNAEAIISASNINQNVINDCIADAQNNGYTLDVTTYNEGHYSSRYATLKLTYDYEIPLLKVASTHTKVKIAR